jgi:anti-anti-sigma factor
VEYVSSLVLGLLVMLRKQAMSKGGQVVLCGLSPVVREMFDRTMLSRSWDIRESKADAFAVLA